ncbi:basic salivary proline-rich protein 1-like [Camelus ferus]|uniref:Basic salivary proline-rich protein 1-like n=1 Tax=Camelus ferus TaxID=419612 RepID=A0A8B8RWL7_CAMFR|nr:basic salivary proline-rich protein 1-like [Camelus ferus]
MTRLGFLSYDPTPVEAQRPPGPAPPHGPAGRRTRHRPPVSAVLSSAVLLASLSLTLPLSVCGAAADPRAHSAVHLGVSASTTDKKMSSKGGGPYRAPTPGKQLSRACPRLGPGTQQQAPCSGQPRNAACPALRDRPWRHEGHPSAVNDTISQDCKILDDKGCRDSPESPGASSTVLSNNEPPRGLPVSPPGDFSTAPPPGLDTGARPESPFPEHNQPVHHSCWEYRKEQGNSDPAGTNQRHKETDFTVLGSEDSDAKLLLQELPGRMPGKDAQAGCRLSPPSADAPPGRTTAPPPNPQTGSRRKCPPPSGSLAVLAAHWLLRPSVRGGWGLLREGGTLGPRLREGPGLPQTPGKQSFSKLHLSPTLASSHAGQGQAEDAAVLRVKQAVDWIPPRSPQKSSFSFCNGSVIHLARLKLSLRGPTTHFCPELGSAQSGCGRILTAGPDQSTSNK